MSRSEVLRRRVEWCATLAASLPPGTVRTALDNLVLEHLRDLGPLLKRGAVGVHDRGGASAAPALMSGVNSTLPASSPNVECP